MLFVTRKKSDQPHAYLHRAHVSGDSSRTLEAYIPVNRGVLIFRDGTMVKGTQRDIFDNALLAHKLQKLEAFAVLDREDGLLVSQGTSETSFAAHKFKHPYGHQVVMFDVPAHGVEYFGVWESSKEKLLKQKPDVVIKKHLAKKRKIQKASL